MSAIIDNNTPVSKATFAIADLGLNTPLKVDLADKLVATPVVDEVEEVTTTIATTTTTTTSEEEEPIEDFRLRFVGEVDIDEKDEPLLKESQRRFVLFPIQYHEVCLTFVIIIEDDEKRPWLTFSYLRFGKCTKKPKHLSGQRKKWIFPRIYTIGRTSSTTMNAISSLTSSLSSLHPTGSSMRTS
jgi:hypothetical protein